MRCSRECAVEPACFVVSLTVDVYACASARISLHPRCVFTAVLGMATVVWYALGGHVSDAEMEQEARAKLQAKRKRGKMFGLMRPKTA